MDGDGCGGTGPNLSWGEVDDDATRTIMRAIYWYGEVVIVRLSRERNNHPSIIGDRYIADLFENGRGRGERKSGFGQT